jgi:tetratricopeptide (TPR) repeat protein
MKKLLLVISAVALCALQARIADAQVMPGGGGMGGGGMGGRGQMPPGAGGMPDEPPTVADDKPDVAARKDLKIANKALEKAKSLEADAASTKDPDKKAKDLEKLGDQYNLALDAFTDALSHKSDLVEAWDQVGYIHLHQGAYRESIDDYDHTLALKPELMEAIEHRAEAYLAVDHLDEVKVAYMDLYNHVPDLAAQLMAAMQKWVAAHQADPNRSHNAEVEAFGKWVSDRDGVAKQTASIPH